MFGVSVNHRDSKHKIRIPVGRPRSIREKIDSGDLHKRAAAEDLGTQRRGASCRSCCGSKGWVQIDVWFFLGNMVATLLITAGIVLKIPLSRQIQCSFGLGRQPEITN